MWVFTVCDGGVSETVQGLGRWWLLCCGEIWGRRRSASLAGRKLRAELKLGMRAGWFISYFLLVV